MGSPGFNPGLEEVSPIFLPSLQFNTNAWQGWTGRGRGRVTGEYIISCFAALKYLYLQNI